MAFSVAIKLVPGFLSMHRVLGYLSVDLMLGYPFI
jgi:hypothetical protein